MGNAHVHGREVVQLVLVGPARPAAGEVVGDVGQMQEDGDRIDEDDGTDSPRCLLVLEQVG